MAWSYTSHMMIYPLTRQYHDREDSWLERQRWKKKRTRIVGLLIAILVLAVAGGVAFAVWWFTSRPKDATGNRINTSAS
jgi:flagellar basal body-associated protein FliL